MATRITDEIHEWVSEEYDRQSMGDQVSYDLSLMFDQTGAKLILIAMMPSVVLGTVIQAINWVGLPIQREAVTELVRVSLETMRNQRSQEASLGNGSASGGAPGGLITPGG